VSPRRRPVGEWRGGGWGGGRPAGCIARGRGRAAVGDHRRVLRNGPAEQLLVAVRAACVTLLTTRSALEAAIGSGDALFAAAGDALLADARAAVATPLLLPNAVSAAFGGSSVLSGALRATAPDLPSSTTEVFTSSPNQVT